MEQLVGMSKSKRDKIQNKNPPTELVPAVYRLSSFHHHAIAARTCAATEQNVYAIVGLTSARQLDSGYVSGGQ